MTYVIGELAAAEKDDRHALRLPNFHYGNDIK